MRVRHLLLLVAVVAACDSGSSTTPVTHDGAAGRGGAAAGGASAAGGESGTGGASASGGTSAGTKGTGGTAGATAVGGTTGRGGATAAAGATGLGGRTGPGRDAGAEVTGRLDGVAGAGGGSGTGGARTDAAPEARPDVPVDVARDAGADTGFVKPTPVPDGGICPFKGNVTYTITPSSDKTADEQIKKAMDQAVFYYNCYSNLSRALTVSYNSSVQTADGNINGNIRFGPSGYRTLRVAMHEIGHTFGVGTAGNWGSFIDKGSSSSGPWTGKNGIAQRDALLPDHWQDTQRVLTADGHSFWPYGLNLDSDYKTEDDLIGHCMMVMAIRMDLGLK